VFAVAEAARQSLQALPRLVLRVLLPVQGVAVVAELAVAVLRAQVGLVLPLLVLPELVDLLALPVHLVVGAERASPPEPVVEAWTLKFATH